jgi:hypothetical protein
LWRGQDLPKGVAVNGTRPEALHHSIADGYRDLLLPLNEDCRHSLIHRLTQRFYEGWRPTRHDLATLIAQKTSHPVDSQHAGTAASPTTNAAGTQPEPAATPTGNGTATPRTPPRPNTAMRPAAAHPGRHPDHRSRQWTRWVAARLTTTTTQATQTDGVIFPCGRTV